MSQKTVPARDNSKLIFQALEPRIMFDGAAVFTATEVIDQLEQAYGKKKLGDLAIKIFEIFFSKHFFSENRGWK